MQRTDVSGVAARALSRKGPADYGKTLFAFQDVLFVDVAVALHNGQKYLNRTLVIEDKSASGTPTRFQTARHYSAPA